MKKHITIIALAMLSLATVFSGCKKSDDDKTESKKYNVRYELDSECKTVHPLTGDTIVFTLSTCFKANITYTDADGKAIELKDITLPWQKEIIVEAPFDASMQAELTFKEEELPDTLTVVKSGRIGFKKAEDSSFAYEDGHGNYGVTWQKDKFLNRIQENPNYLKFDYQHSLQ